MDEIDWLKSLKKGLIFFIEVSTGFAIFIFFIALLNYIKGFEEAQLMFFISLITFLGIPAFFIIIYAIIFIFYKIFNSKRIIQNFNKEYVKDLPQHCSPTLCSFIYDLKIDVYKDYTATILYLCLKKYLKLTKHENTYTLSLTNQTDYSNLGRCEKYVIDLIKNKKELDEKNFKAEIIKEAQEKNFITNKVHIPFFKILLILIFFTGILIISHKINFYLFIILLSIIITILYLIIYFLIAKIKSKTNFYINTAYKRTNDGKKIALLLSGLKNYIKDYTLIKEKEIDYIQVLEDYIPYALSLDEANVIEEFIKYNEEYRNLIYNI